MLVLEAKLKGKLSQYDLIDEAIIIALFIRNKALRFCLDNQGIGKTNLQKLWAVLAKHLGLLTGLIPWLVKLPLIELGWLLNVFMTIANLNSQAQKGYPS